MIRDRRTRFREGLHPLYLPRYDLLCERLTPEWQPYSGLRTFKEQALLFSQGRTSPGSVVTQAEAGLSPHNWGCASDWARFENGIFSWPNRKDPTWAIYVGAVQSVAGLRSGFDFGDTPHNELKLSCRWRDVYAAFLQGGTEAAHEQIRLHLVA